MIGIRLRRLVLALLPVLVVLAPAATAQAGKAPFDPAGVVLAGTEKHPDAGKLPVAFHLGSDGTAVGDIIDLEGSAFGFTGTWTFDDGMLIVELEPVTEEGSSISATLKMKGSGKGKGTMTRGDGEAGKLKVKQVFPAPRAKGFTAVIPRFVHTGTTGAGAVRGTLVLRNDGAAKKKPKPLTLELRTLGLNGVPGLSRTVDLLPGETVILDGGQMPGMLIGSETDTRQIVLTSRKKKGFDPDTVSILAYEETLRDLDPATSGTALPVHWAARLKKKDLAARDAVPHVAPWFLDEGDGAGVRRSANLMLRDLSQHSGEEDLGSVLVSLFAGDGVAIGSGEIDLPRGATISVDPWDLLDSPEEFSSVEGWMRITAAGGGGIGRGRLAAFVDGTVIDDGVAIASLVLPADSLATAGTTATLVAPWVLAPDDGPASTALHVTNTGESATNVNVRVLAPDGSTLHNTTVPVPAGETRRVDPGSVGMDLSLLNATEGRAQVLVGPDDGLSLDTVAAFGEVIQLGSPNAYLTGVLVREGPESGPDGEVLRLLDGIETFGSDPGDADTQISVRNGGTAAATVTVRVLNPDGTSVGSVGEVSVEVDSGAVLDLVLEDVLVSVGAPVDVEPDEFRGVLEVVLPAGSGPFTGVGVQFRHSGQVTGGVLLPVQRR